MHVHRATIRTTITNKIPIVFTISNQRSSILRLRFSIFKTTKFSASYSTTAKMSWMDSWSRPSKSQATPAPYYLIPGGEETPYCKYCGRVISKPQTFQSRTHPNNNSRSAKITCQQRNTHTSKILLQSMPKPPHQRSRPHNRKSIRCIPD